VKRVLIETEEIEKDPLGAIDLLQLIREEGKLTVSLKGIFKLIFEKDIKIFVNKTQKLFFMDEYKRQVDTELNSIMNNYYHATSSLLTFKEDTPKTSSDLLYDTLQIKRAASNIVHSVESLLQLTAQLKQSVILNDVKATNQQLLSRKSLLQKQNDSTLELFKGCLHDCKQVYKQVEDALNL
jgi:hypothetical protein